MSQRSIEAFLEGAFCDLVRPTGTVVGRVTVEPKDTAILDETERDRLADELLDCIKREIAKPAFNLKSPQGHDVPLYPLLNKYLRAIILYPNNAMGSWVQVLPHGDFRR